MAPAKLLVILAVQFLNADARTIVNFNNLRGYYWRDFDGNVPKDALQGSKLNNGQVLYVGQALNPGFSITPGYIKANDPHLYYEYGGADEKSNSEDVKILCTQQPEQFSWRPVKNNDPTSVITEGDLVVGGHDRKQRLGIGKIATAQGELLGKVLIIGDKFNLIFYDLNGKGLYGAEYRVLIYRSRIASEVVRGEGCNDRIINFNVY